VAALKPDVQPVGADAKGYNGLGLHGIGRTQGGEDIIKFGARQGPGQRSKDEVGSVALQPRMISAMLAVEGGAPRAGALRQEARADRRADPLGLEKPGDRPEEARRALASAR